MNNKTRYSANVTLVPSGKRFETLADQNILKAGLAVGATIPYGCTNGSCGECRGRVLSGQVRKIRPHDFTLTEAQKLDGLCLLCSYAPMTDVSIEIIRSQNTQDIPVQQLQAKLQSIETIESIDIITLKMTRGNALRFLPGQSAVLRVGDTVSTAAIASCPCNAHTLEFHVHNNHQHPDTLAVGEEGELPEIPFRTLPRRCRISIEGPSGKFTLSQHNSNAKVFFARGLEFCRLQGMLEQIINIDSGAPFHLIWQSTDTITHYRHNLCRSWQDAVDEFTYSPLESDNINSAEFDNNNAEASYNGSNADTMAVNAILEACDLIGGSCELYFGGKNNHVINSLVNTGFPHNMIFAP